MADQGKDGIAWTDKTWNPIRGCSRVSEGCRHCYAEGIAARFSGPGQPFEGLAKRVGGEARWTGDIRFIEHKVADPLRWKRPQRVFVNSVSDLFHEKVTDDMRHKIFAVMTLAPQHKFQVLTKRPHRMRDYLRRLSAGDLHCAASDLGYEMHIDPALPLPNVWIGTSTESQSTYDDRAPSMADLKKRGWLTFMSAEPLLSRIDLGVWIPDWVISGGESGPRSRFTPYDLFRSLRDQCVGYGVAYLHKQNGIHDEGGKRVGKKAAGRLLDGVLHDDYPRAA